MAMARKEFTEEEIAILRTSPHPGHGHLDSVVQLEVFHGAPPYHRRAVFITYTDILQEKPAFVHYTFPISV